MHVPFLSKSFSRSAHVEVQRRGFSFPDIVNGDHGGGPSVTIPDGNPFAGRTAGGGTRRQIFGTKTYGSGYPGIEGRGVVGRPLPFWFWPVVWSINASQIQPYLNGTEYGDSSNPARFGGPLKDATFISGSKAKTKFHVISDSDTDESLGVIFDECYDYLSIESWQGSSSFNPNSQYVPKPEQAIQYYRASSVVFTLDGYNNSATLSSNESVPDSPLPQHIDMDLLNCINRTIGSVIPLGHASDPMDKYGPLLGLIPILLAAAVLVLWVFWLAIRRIMIHVPPIISSSYYLAYYWFHRNKPDLGVSSVTKILFRPTRGSGESYPLE